MKYLCLCKRPRVFLLNGTSVPSFLGMVWVYTTDVRVIHDVVRSLRSGAVQKPSWEGTVGCLEAWTPLLTYQTRPSFPFSGSNRPLFSFLGFFSSTHSNFLVSFSCIVDSGPTLTLLRIQNACGSAPLQVGVGLWWLQKKGLVWIPDFEAMCLQLKQAKMFSFYLVNLGIRPCLNSLGCLSGEFQMCGMLQLDIFVLVL